MVKVKLSESSGVIELLRIGKIHLSLFLLFNLNKKDLGNYTARKIGIEYIQMAGYTLELEFLIK